MFVHIQVLYKLPVHQYLEALEHMMIVLQKQLIGLVLSMHYFFFSTNVLKMQCIGIKESKKREFDVYY